MFGILLKFVAPKDACRLGATSKTFLRWTERSARWKGWCEDACPSITTSPAQDIVRAHCERTESAYERARAYKRLYAALMQGAGILQESSPVPSWSDFVAQLQDSVLLVDVFADSSEEAVRLAFSVDGGQMNPTSDEPFRTEATCIPGAEKWLKLAFEEDRLNPMDSSLVSRLLAGEPVEAWAANHEVLGFSCKMMRKSESGNVNTLHRKRAFFTVELWPRWLHSARERHTHRSRHHIFSGDLCGIGRSVHMQCGLQCEYSFATGTGPCSRRWGESDVQRYMIELSIFRRA